MNRASVRRKIRKRRGNPQKTKMKFTSVLVIMAIAVFLGYLTARFVIGPILGYNADESPVKVGSETTSETTEEGYALQFGVFSTKEGADKLVASLATKGIEAKVIEENDQFKVISPIIQTKDKALDKLAEIKDKDVKDVFIASF